MLISTSHISFTPAPCNRGGIYTIAPASICDICHLDAIYDTIHAAYRGNHPNSWTCKLELVNGERISYNALRECVKTSGQDGYMLLIAWSECKQVRGTVEVRPVMIEEEACGLIGLLAVHPEMQSMGVGKRLVETAEVYTREVLRYKHAAVWVMNTAENIMKWYLRMGYAMTRETRPHPTCSSVHFHVLKKVL